MRKSIYAFASSLLLTLCASCVDDTYDLSKDIDLTINVGGSEFAIPGGETEAIPLSKILKIDSGDLVYIDETTGNYYASKKGTPASSTIHVNGFSFDEPDIKPTYKEIEFEPETMLYARIAGTGINFTAVLNEEDYTSDFEMSATDLPAEIVSLSQIYADINLSIDLYYSSKQLKKAKIKDIIIDLPDYLITEGTDAGNIVHIRNLDVYSGNTVTTNVKVKGLNIIAGMMNTTKRTLDIAGTVKLYGELSVNSNDIDGLGTEAPAFVFVSQVKIKDAAKSDKKVHILGAKGIFNPDIDINIDPITIGALPTFLRDQDVVLDLSNPMILFTANNATPLNADVNARLRATSETSEVIVTPPTFRIPAQSAQTYCISPYAPADKTLVHVCTPDLPKLIQKIPKNIYVDASVTAVNEETIVDLDADYSFDTDYSIWAPFRFGDNLCFAYRDDWGNWNDDIRDLDFDMINVTGTAINKIPLDIEVSAVALGIADSSGERKPLNGVTAKVKIVNETDNILKANSPADIIVEIRESVKGSVSQIDGLEITLKAYANKSTPESQRIINANQTIQFRNIRLKVPGGVRIDLN
ncbi:MAG: hypothetical protein SPJ05_07625 [Candidatus Limisoma sp.]|nr:hypothetical protein [Candidatus Limisoma sp.]